MHYDITQDGLKQPWGDSRVWCNPPYDNKVCGEFLKKCAEHGNAIVLIFARVETGNWHDYIWPKADAVLFLKGRLTFHHVDGTPGSATAGAPSALIAYGKQNALALRNCGLQGKFVPLKNSALDLIEHQEKIISDVTECIEMVTGGWILPTKCKERLLQILKS